EWNEKSKYLVFLTVENEQSLKNLLLKANLKGIKTSSFHEPDIDNQLTSIALEPCEKSKKLCSNLPLAIK
ncbi:MAG: hypothetical protein ACOC1K_01560, partial [Nanoarchaeota archaeon]